MWKAIRKYFDGEREVRRVVSSVDEKVISTAYQRIERQINALRKYDSGEINIDAPDLKTAVRRI